MTKRSRRHFFESRWTQVIRRRPDGLQQPGGRPFLLDFSLPAPPGPPLPRSAENFPPPGVGTVTAAAGNAGAASGPDRLTDGVSILSADLSADRSAIGSLTPPPTLAPRRRDGDCRRWQRSAAPTAVWTGSRYCRPSAPRSVLSHPATNPGPQAWRDGDCRRWQRERPRPPYGRGLDIVGRALRDRFFLTPPPTLAPRRRDGD